MFCGEKDIQFQGSLQSMENPPMVHIMDRKENWPHSVSIWSLNKIVLHFINFINCGLGFLWANLWQQCVGLCKAFSNKASKEMLLLKHWCQECSCVLKFCSYSKHFYKTLASSTHLSFCLLVLYYVGRHFLRKVVRPP